jgi:3-hydroxyisobutyrate dehydrogenase
VATKGQVALLGVGAMGRPMGANLLRAGYAVAAYDVRPEASAALAGEGATQASSPADASRGADYVLVMVLNAAQARSVLLGDDGALGTLAPGATVLQMATIGRDEAVALAAECAARGVRFLDAPVSGGTVGATEGTLSIIVGGDPATVEEARPLLAIVGGEDRIWHVGPNPGDGQVMKSVNQLLVGVHLAAACEAMTYAAKAGLDVRQAYDIIKVSAGQSRIFDLRAQQMIDGRFDTQSGQLGIFIKDLGIVMDTAAQLNMPLFLATVARQMVHAGVAAGWGTEDDAGLVRVYERLANATVSSAE